MQKLTLFLVFLFVIALTFTLPISAGDRFTTNMPALVVIGQADFTSNSPNQGSTISAYGIDNPRGIATDGIRLFVADRPNNRVLIWNSIPTTNNTPADVVVGQLDFTNNLPNQGGTVGPNTLFMPYGVETDGHKLFIADSNQRVLIYNSIPTTNGASADLVIGQPDMYSSLTGTSANRFRSVTGVAYDKKSGKLFVADTLNNRVLIYNRVPTTNDAPADAVVGQLDFTSGAPGHTAQFIDPGSTAIKVINDKLVVSDLYNNRILIWNSIPTTNGVSANTVVGQVNLTDNLANQGASPSANTLYYPFDQVLEKKLFFASDTKNNRVLIYDDLPNTNNQSAVIVIGQPSFTVNSPNQGASPSANTLNFPTGVTITSQGWLIVADSGNNRLLIFHK